jgi:hypothetical protein
MHAGSVGKPTRRWEGNIKMNLTKIRWEGMDWIHLAQDRVDIVPDNDPFGSMKFLN